MVTFSDHDVEQESKKRIFRRQELQDLRKLQIEVQTILTFSIKFSERSFCLIKQIDLS